MKARAESGDRITVNVPDELPTLTPRASRILLAILVELTDCKKLGDSDGGGPRDC